MSRPPSTVLSDEMCAEVLQIWDDPNGHFDIFKVRLYLMGKFTQTEECLVLVGGNRQPAPRMLQSVDANLWGVAPGIVLYQAQCSAHYFSGFLIKTKDPLLGYYVTGFGSGGMNGRIQGNTTFELPTLKCPQVHIVTSTGWNKKSAKRWRNQSGGQCFIPTDHWPAIHTWLEKYLG